MSAGTDCQAVSCMGGAPGKHLALSKALTARAQFVKKLISCHMSTTSNPGVVLYERPECAQVFFLFAGLGEMLMMNPVVFLQETGLSLRNVVLFKDSLGANYQRGVSDEIPSFPALLDWQRNFLDARPHLSEVFTAGTSAGGPAAMHSAHDLHARGCWTFGARCPKTSLIPALRAQMQVLLGARSPEEAARIFTEMPEIWRREFFELRETPARVIDQAALARLVDLLSRPNGVTRYEVYYCPRSPVDAFLAKRLEIIPEVTIHCIDHPEGLELPCYDTGHNVLKPLQFLGRLPTMFPEYKPAA